MQAEDLHVCTYYATIAFAQKKFLVSIDWDDLHTQRERESPRSNNSHVHASSLRQGCQVLENYIQPKVQPNSKYISEGWNIWNLNNFLYKKCIILIYLIAIDSQTCYGIVHHLTTLLLRWKKKEEAAAGKQINRGDLHMSQQDGGRKEKKGDAIMEGREKNFWGGLV